MLFERIESVGLAHYSYLLGAAGKAIVIDPRRDCDVYMDIATSHGYRVGDIVETHRNEDYVTGSIEIASRTGADIWHADSQLPYSYGEPVTDGQRWSLGLLTLEALATPGHTPGSMSYLLRDPGGAPWMVFTGDALFAGDVGRTDLADETRAAESAGVLYESLRGRVLPLGDEVLLWPAHGHGSACGAAIADRPMTTIGFERAHNPRLALPDKEAFVAAVGRVLERPPYFRRVEQLNIDGPPVFGSMPVPRPLSPAEFAERGAQVVDTRDTLAFATAHVPGALCVQLDMVGAFAGWFLDHDRPILLIGSSDDPTEATRQLLRLGFDEVDGYLSGGMLAWHTAGRDSEEIVTLTVQQLCHALDSDEEPWILDVRSPGELASVGRIPGAHHIHIKGLSDRIDEVPSDRRVYVFCGTGLRSMIAASVLRQAGRRDLAVVLGGFSGWTSISCPLATGSGPDGS